MGTLSNLPTGNTLRHTHVASLNLNPSSFNFYQTKPVYVDYNSLAQNRLSGCFDILSDHQSITKSGLLLNDNEPLEQFTVECWVKANINAGSSATVFYLSSGTGSSNYVYLYNPSNLTINLRGNNMTTGVNIRDGLWHHIALTFEMDQPIQCYVDTVSVSLSSPITYSSTYQLYDGGSIFFGARNTTSSSYAFSGGFLGQLRIWNTIRSLGQIVFNAGHYLMPGEEVGLSLYWSDQFDGDSISDSSGNHNTGTVVNTDNQTIWNTTQHYGALLDETHLEPHPTNMSGSLVISEFRTPSSFSEGDNGQVFFGGGGSIDVLTGNISGLSQSSSANTDITVECWIKIASGNDNLSGIFEFAPNESGNFESFSVYNPANLTVSSSAFGMGTGATPINLQDGRWHHIAVVRSVSGITLYLDTVEIPLNWEGASTDSFTITNQSYLRVGAVVDGLAGGHSVISHSSEWRLWNVSRTRDEIISDASYRLRSPQDNLLVYWPFARNFFGQTQSTVEDFSGMNNSGVIHGNTYWENNDIFGLLSNGYPVPPSPEPSAGAGAPQTQWQYGQLDIKASLSGGTIVSGAADGFPTLTIDQLEQSFSAAHSTGYFEPIVFPNVYLVDQNDRDRAKDAIVDLEFEEFKTYWISGRRLSLFVNEDDTMGYEFIPIPKGYGPTILLMYGIKTASYYGDVGEGQVVRTFSLMPGESTFASITTYKNSSSSEEQSSSVLDSASDEAKQSFQGELEGEMGLKAAFQTAFALHGSAEGKEGFILESVDVKGSADASGSASISGTLSILGKALAKHSEDSSASRNVEVDTSYTVTTESGKETSITREFKNINNSTTLDILFKQMNQEYRVMHYCSDIQIAYYDPRPGSYRRVRLYQLDDLLDQVLIDDAQTKLDYKQSIINEVYRINNFAISDTDQSFILAKDKMTGQTIDWSSIIDDSGAIVATPEQQYFVNTNASTTVQTTSDGDSEATFKGLLMREDSFVMRTDNVVADVILGGGVGLDEYALGLQQAAVERENAENRRLELENSKLEVALAILNKATDGGADADALAELYYGLFRKTPPNKTVVLKDGTDTGDLLIS